jgi:VanZ family protein
MPVICVTESKYTSPIATNQSYKAYVPAVILAAGIAMVSLWENPHAPLVQEVSDKVLHGAMYMLLSVSLAGALFYNHHAWWRTAAWVCFGVTLYGGILELLQATCTQTRSGEWMDVLADGAGAVLGFVLVWVISYLWQKRTTHTT